MDSGKVTVRAAAVQFLATFTVCILIFLTGMLFSWPSYNVVNFASNETVLSAPMSSLEISLLGSLTNIGAFLMTPFYGVMINKLGRKYTVMLAGLPYLIGWSIVTVTKSVPAVLSAMCIAGCGTGGQAAISIFIAEISHDSIRGALTSCVVCVYFIGLLISYILGGCLSYSQVVYVQLSVSVVVIVLISFLKESPIYLVQIGKEKEAAESLAFYRQASPTSKEVEVEIAKIKLQLDPRLEQMLEGEENPDAKQLIASLPPEKKLSEWQYLKKSKTSIRALITGLVTMSTMILMGNIALQVYAETLFKEAVPNLDSNQCSIFLAIDLLIASIVCTFMIDKFGRRFLMISTCIGSSICTLILAIQIQMHWAPHWFTAFLIYLYNFVFNIGVAVVPYVLVAELFLPEVRGLCGSIVLASAWAMNFITVVFFTPVVELYGFAPLFYAFTAIGFAGAAFCIYYQPETSGLSVDAIQALFLKKDKRKVGD